MIASKSPIIAAFFFSLTFSLVGGQSDSRLEAELKAIRQTAAAGNLQIAWGQADSVHTSIDTAAHRKEHASILTLKGTILFMAGQWEQSLSFHERALMIRKKAFGLSAPAVASSYLNIGNCWMEMGAWQEAEDFFLKSYAIKKEELNVGNAGLINICNNLGALYKRMGKYKLSREYLEKSLAFAEEEFGSTSINLIEPLSNLGDLFRQQYFPDSAILLYSTAIDIQKSEHVGSHPITAKLYSQIANAYVAKGWFDTAMTFFENAYSICRALPDGNTLEVVNCLYSMGNCLLEKGDAWTAERYFNQALNLTGEDFQSRANLMNSLGLSFRYRGDFERAIHFFNEAISLLLSAEEPEGMEKLAGIQRNIGGCLYEQGEFGDAILFLNQAFNFYPLTASTLRERSACLNQLALCHLERKEFAEAEALLNSSMSLMQEVDGVGRFPVLFHFGQLKQAMGLPREAIELYQESSGLLSMDREETAAVFPTETIQICAALADSWRQLGRETHRTDDWGSCLQWADKGIVLLQNLTGRLEDRQSVRDNRNDFYTLFSCAVEAALFLKDEQRAFSYIEKYHGNLQKRFFENANWKGGTGLLANLREKEISMSRELANLKKERYRLYENENEDLYIFDPKELDEAIFQLGLEKDKLDSLIKKKYPEYFQLSNKQSSTTPSQICQILQIDETLLQYHWGNDKVFLFVFTRDTFLVETIAKADQLGREIERLYQVSSTPPDYLNGEERALLFQEWATLSHKIYLALVNPAEPYLKKRILVVKDGQLNYLPLEMLVDQEIANPDRFRLHPFLVKKYEFQYLPSASFLVFNKTKNKSFGNGLLAFAPTFEGNSLGLTSLHNNQAEIDTVIKTMGGLGFKKAEALEEVYAKYCGDAQVVHFSTHGILNDRYPEYSYLAFTERPDSVENELLFVSEIYSQPIQSELVVLSACQTASGKLYRGEGLASIGQAFFQAGAESLVASLWNVDDKQAPGIMSDFYQHLKLGQPKSMALWSAQNAYIAKSSFLKAHPYYWAGFVSMGDPSTLTQSSFYSAKALIAFGVALLLIMGIVWFKRRANQSQA